MSLKEQFRSIIQWENPKDWQIFYRFTDRGDEIKNVSKLILQPGQGCLFTYEGRIEAVFEEEGMYDLKTDNKPFWTTVKKFMNFFESEHKVGIWFYRKGHITNIRWGTRIPITYQDPVYGFPVNLRCFGNYSIQITQPKAFFTNIVSGKLDYFCGDLQELFLSRITQPISNYLANAEFSYTKIDSNIEKIAADAKEKTNPIFYDLGFDLLDFRIEGNSFDADTVNRIAEISDVQADVKSADIAGVDFAELQKLRAMRDMAKNEGAAGAGMGLFTGMEMGKSIGDSNTKNKADEGDDIMAKLKKLKTMFENELISEEEYAAKKQQLLDSL